MVQVHPENITGIGKGVFRLGYLSLCPLRRCYHNYRRRHLPGMSAKSPEDGWRNCMLQVNGLAFQPRLVTEYTHIVNEEYYKRWMREQKYNLLVACICANAVPETWYPKLTPMQYLRCTYLLRYCRIRQRHIASLKKKNPWRISDHATYHPTEGPKVWDNVGRCTQAEELPSVSVPWF